MRRCARHGARDEAGARKSARHPIKRRGGRRAAGAATHLELDLRVNLALLRAEHWPANERREDRARKVLAGVAALDELRGSGVWRERESAAESAERSVRSRADHGRRARATQRDGGPPGGCVPRVGREHHAPPCRCRRQQYGCRRRPTPAPPPSPRSRRRPLRRPSRSIRGPRRALQKS